MVESTFKIRIVKSVSSWRIGIGLYHRKQETYLRIDFFKVSLYVGNILEIWGKDGQRKTS